MISGDGSRTAAAGRLTLAAGRRMAEQLAAGRFIAQAGATRTVQLETVNLCEVTVDCGTHRMPTELQHANKKRWLC